MENWKNIPSAKIKKYNYYIGIDTGLNTGIAVWSTNKNVFTDIESVPIHRGFEMIKQLSLEYPNYSIFIRVEDARKRKWFGTAGKEQLQGAGSIKRDAKIWEDFLTELGIDFEMVAPKNNKTKLSGELFKKITGWDNRTNQHGRDAAMLVFDYE